MATSSFFFSLFSTTTRTSLHSNTNYAVARTDACLHRLLIFFASVRKRNIKRLEKTFFFILFRSTVCFLEFLLSFSSTTTTTTIRYYYHKRRQLLQYIYIIVIIVS
jgi:hypothetical protein